MIAFAMAGAFPVQADERGFNVSAPEQTPPDTPIPTADATTNVQTSPDTSQRPEAPAQNNPHQRRTETSKVDEVVVTAPRPRGSVTGNIPSERTFSPLEVRAFGVTNIAELIEVLAPQISSSNGREDKGPITLLNGRRVSSFAEVSNIPSEAIERVEVFPEAVALNYGYRADQKVVNIVTFERYSSRIGQAAYSAPTEGARDTADISANYFAIRDETRLNLNATYSRSDALLESDRRVRQPLDAFELGRFRTLLPESQRFALSGVVSLQALEAVSSTFNGRFEISEFRSLLGPDAGIALARDSETSIVQIGTTQDGRIGEWNWTFTGNYSRNQTESLTDLAGLQAFREKSRAVNSRANSDLLLRGTVLQLPAGPVAANIRAGFEAHESRNSSHRPDLTSRNAISRETGVVQGSITLPVFGVDEGEKSPLGALAVNANFDLETLSDFGTLYTYGYGLNWSPVATINLIASTTYEEGAPTLEQLGAPLLLTPNSRLFDFSRGEVVDVTRVSGGNASLLPDSRRVASLGLDMKPFASADFTASIDYVMTRTDNPVAPFPMATPEIEAAFPERFTRDSDGRLLQIDSRPVNFSRSEQRELRWGLNFTRMLGPQPPLPPGVQSQGSRVYASEAEMRRKLPPGVRVVEALPGSPAAKRMEALSSRLYISFYHTWRLKDELRLQDGGATIDLLDGGGLNFRGGSRRHRLEFQAGAFRRGLGARLSAVWQGGSEVYGFGSPTEALAFSDLTTVNLSLFANLADQFQGTPAADWLKGARATLRIDNVLNSRLEVRNEAGMTPLNYQSAYFDPLGRTVTFEIRKIF